MKDHDHGWAMWAICGWLGQYSKYHWIRPGGLTACGRIPNDEIHGSDLSHLTWQSRDVRDDEKCLACLRVTRAAEER
jgi:hypothetical protein